MNVGSLRIAIMVFVSVALLSTARAEIKLAQQISSENSSDQRIVAKYSGYYSCAQGMTSLTIELLRPEVGSEAAAIFEFGPSSANPSVPSGAFLLRGTVNLTDGSLDLRPLSWLSKPAGYVMVGLSGISRDGGSTFKGTVDGPACTAFSINRVSTASSASAPQPTSIQKTDIQGLYPGMTLTELTQNPPAGFACHYMTGPLLGQGYCDRSNTEGNNEDRFNLKISKFINPAVVIRITYEFTAAIDFDSLVDQISTAYNSPAEGDVKRIDDSEIQEIITDRAFITQYPYIVWNLVDKVYLALTEAMPNAPVFKWSPPIMNSACRGVAICGPRQIGGGWEQAGNAPKWRLTVWDRGLIEKDNTAKELYTKQIAPPPKF